MFVGFPWLFYHQDWKLKCLIRSISERFLQRKFTLKVYLTAKFFKHDKSYLSIVIYSHVQDLYHYEFSIVMLLYQNFSFGKSKQVKTQKPYDVLVVLQNADWVLLANCTYMLGWVDLY